MPIIHRITHDMFEMSSVMDFMINPVNLKGVPGAGLALEFRRRCPDYVEVYRQACRDESLRIGTIQVIDETNQPWGIINLPTKRHYQDTSNKDDIARGLEALRTLLKSDAYKYASICLPMLGCGLGKQDYSVVHPMMLDYLGDLEACVFLSMSPERTDLRPTYLLIDGASDYGLNDDEKDHIDHVIDTILNKWNKSLSDYEAIITSGHLGVGQYIGGRYFNTNYKDTYVYKQTSKKPFVIRPNEAKNQASAILRQGELLCEIADDIILFKPKGHDNTRLSLMQKWIDDDKPKRLSENKPIRRVAVFGELDYTMKPHNVMVQVNEYDNR